MKKKCKIVQNYMKFLKMNFYVSLQREKIELETNVDISFRPIFSHLDIFSKISWTQIKAA